MSVPVSAVFTANKYSKTQTSSTAAITAATANYIRLREKSPTTAKDTFRDTLSNLIKSQPHHIPQIVIAFIHAIRSADPKNRDAHSELESLFIKTAQELPYEQYNQVKQVLSNQKSPIVLQKPLPSDKDQTLLPLTRIHITPQTNTTKLETEFQNLCTTFLTQYPEYDPFIQALNAPPSHTTDRLLKTLQNSINLSPAHYLLLQIITLHNQLTRTSIQLTSTVDGEGGEGNETYTHNGVDMLHYEKTARKERTLLMMWLISEMWEAAKVSSRIESAQQTLMSPIQHFQQCWKTSPFATTIPYCNVSQHNNLPDIFATIQNHPTTI
jgi:hypothetical protein